MNLLLYFLDVLCLQNYEDTSEKKEIKEIKRISGVDIKVGDQFICDAVEIDSNQIYYCGPIRMDFFPNNFYFC